MCHVESIARTRSRSIQRLCETHPCTLCTLSLGRRRLHWVGALAFVFGPHHLKPSANMGILISRLFEGLFGSKEVRILILGLDNAGKTTILYRLQNESDEAVQTIPTIGFNVETLQYKNIKVRQRTSRAGGADGWRRRRRGRPAGGGDAGHLVIGLPPSFSTLNTSLQSSRTN